MLGPRPRAAPSRCGRRPHGIALVLVMWVLALLTVMALGLTTAQRTNALLTSNQLEGARFRARAEAALSLTALELMRSGTFDELGAALWTPDGRPRRLVVEGAPLDVTLYNEASRIELNSATREQLAVLIELAQGADGFDAVQRDQIADAILDWRDEDDLVQLNGAEDADYEAAGLTYGAADEPFRSIGELRLILGMTQPLYERLAPHLRVAVDQNQEQEVDERFASPEVLAALNGITMDEALRQVEQREQPTVPDGEGPRALERGGPLYRVRIQQAGAGRGRRALEILMRLEPGASEPPEILWRREGLAARQDAARTEEVTEP